MSTKTKKLSQLLFRRSSTNSGSSKPQFMAGGNNNKNSKEDSDLSPLLIPQIVETTPKLVSHVIFSDKPFSPRRSYSPTRVSPDTQPVSILKNGHGPRARTQAKKATLQRTKSTPITSSKEPNPLQDVSWNCPTLEKRKEMILNYFRNIVIDNGNLVNKNPQDFDESETSEPIYEEIEVRKPEVTNKTHLMKNNNNDNNKSNMDSLKPKIAPKKFRLNIPKSQPTFDNDDNNNNQPPIYDKVLARASSFNVYEDIQSIRSNKEKYLMKSKSQNRADDPLGESKQNETVGLAHFASQVAQHAKANRSNSFNFLSSSKPYFSKSKSSSSSSSPRSSSSGSSTSSASSTSSNFDSYDFVDVDMDQIYSKIEKRVEKVRSPMSRWLQKYEHQNPSLPAPKHRYQNIPITEDDPNPKEINLILFPQIESKPNYSTPTPTTQSCTKEQLKEVESLAVKEEAANPISPRTINTFAPGGANETRFEEGTPHLLPSSSESESLVTEEQNHDDYHHHHHNHQQPVRPPRGNRQSTASTVFVSSSSVPQPSPSQAQATVQNRNSNFLGNVDKGLIEKDLSSNLNKSKGFLDLADVFPPIGSASCEKNNICNQSVAIDSTGSCPRSYPVGNKSLREDIVTVHLVPKLPLPPPPNLANLMELESGTDAHLLLGNDFPTSHNMTTEMSNFAEEEVGLPSPNLLIETKETISIDKFFWESSHSPSQKSEGGSSTTSDLSESSSSASSSSSSNASSSTPETSVLITESVATMEFNNGNLTSNKRDKSPFIRQEPKFYEDVDEDGGFESFQVVDDPNYEDEGNDDLLSPQSTSPDSGMTVPNRDRTFAQSQQNIPENELKQKASSVLDLINAEISDLHMREMELKHKPQKQDGERDDPDPDSDPDSDDFSDSAVDVGNFTPESNSPGNLTPADGRGRGESPYSTNSQNRDKLDDFAEAVDGHGKTGHWLEGNNSGKTTSGMGTEDESDGLISNSKQQQGGRVRPIVEEEVKSIELNMTKETPIEREIRLVREREDEFRRHRMSTTAPPSDDKDEQVPAEKREVLTTSSPNPATGQMVGFKSLVPKPSATESKPTMMAMSSPTPVAPAIGTPKDIQYEMATARLKREIEEGLMRERELYREGRLKTISDPEGDDTESKGNEEIKEIALEELESSSKTEEKVAEDHNILPSAGRKSLAKLSMPATTTPGKKEQVKTSTPSSGSNSVRFFTPSAFTSNSSGAPINISPVLSPITTPVFPAFPTNEVVRRSSLTTQSTPASGQHHQDPSQSLPMNIAKPQFTSIERMILKGSFSFNKNSMSQEPKNNMMHHEEQSRMSKASRMPDPLQIVHRAESIEETEEREAVEVAKPRRKYVPAQDKIQLELQEQNKRENELSQLRAKWKSTPDLFKSSEEQAENSIDSEEAVVERSQEAESLTKPSYLRRQRSSSTQKLNEIPASEVSTSDVLRMNKPTVRRRQSALINQWEEMIKQQQEKNKN